MIGKGTGQLQLYRVLLIAMVLFMMEVASGCVHRLHAPLQPDGWSARPIVSTCRFTSDADLDQATGTPVGEEGYYLYILTETACWDFKDATALLFSIWRHLSEHSWILLENPQNRLEFGHIGNFGREKPRYHEGVMQRMQEGDPDPIAYLWQTMSDGQLQVHKPDRPPTFVWRMPITQRRHQLIYEYLMQRKYGQFDLRTDNCTDMVVAAAALAGIILNHRIRLTLPPEAKVLGRMRRVWTDHQYRILEFGTPEVLELDLRQLAQIGIGSDATAWYLDLNH